MCRPMHPLVRVQIASEKAVQLCSGVHRKAVCECSFVCCSYGSVSGLGGLERNASVAAALLQGTFVDSEKFDKLCIRLVCDSSQKGVCGTVY